MKKTFKKILMTILVVLVLIPLSLIAGLFFFLNKMETDVLDENKLGISSNEKLEEVTNIALFGTDNRNPNSNSRSDAIMILTVNPKTKKIKISSIMRDSLVEVDGHGQTKINHAYAYGGPELALKTLNTNFDLNIKDYATVDFYSLSKIIDLLGGFEVTLNSGEVRAMNKAINEINRIEKLPYGTDYVHDSSSSQVLNGRQTVSYVRIRKTGNGDYERTERQRRVLNFCIEKIQNLSIPQAISIANEILPLVKTSLTSSEVISLGTKILTSGPYETEQLRIPVDDTFTAGMFGSMWAIKMNMEENSLKLHDFMSN